MADAPAILNFNFYLKINKILKYILFLDIYINMAISRIIINKITEVNDTINVNKGNIGSVCMD